MTTTPTAPRRPRRLLTGVLTSIVVAVALAVALLARGGDPDPEDAGRPPSDPGRVLWNGDASTGDLSQYTVQECEPGRTSVVDDPLGTDRSVIRFTVLDTDVAPCTPTQNPRAQALSPDLLKPGKDYWIGWSVLVPKDFPATPEDGDNWISLGAIYGPPADGASGTGIAMSTKPGAERFYYRRDQAYDFDEPWSMPLKRGRWVHFVFHMKISRDPAVGFREQWVNAGSGWRQSRFEGGTTKLRTATLTEANDDGPNYSKISLYYRKGIMSSGTVFFADHKIGTSFDAVAPAS